MKPKTSKARPRRWTQWMLAITAVLIIGGFLTAWLSQQGSAPVGGTPRLIVDRSTIDFGKAHFYRYVDGIFRLTNAGDGALVIDWGPVVEVAKGC